jgi:hypothetical protein
VKTTVAVRPRGPEKHSAGAAGRLQVYGNSLKLSRTVRIRAFARADADGRYPTRGGLRGDGRSRIA